MDSLAPPELPHQGTPGSPSFPVTIKTLSPYEYPIDLSATSTLPWPLEPMDAYELFWLSENIDDISKIVELLEPNPLMLWTWSYFGHCQWTARQLEEEVRYQKDSAESLLEELRRLGIDEVLRPLITEARWLDRRATRFARPASPITIRLPAWAPTLPMPTLPMDLTTNYSTEADTGGPSRPIVIGTTIQEAMRDPSHPTNKQLCSMQATGNSESGIFGFRKGVMLWFLIISSYHNGLLFHF